MTQVRTFHGYVVNPIRAQEVVAPAYDSLSSDERSSYADSHPDSYLNVMRTREDYPAGFPITTGEILDQNKKNLERMLDDGCFVANDIATFFVYRLSHGEHTQTGLVAEISVAEIDEGKVLKHELTRRDREELLVEYQEYVGASSSPVALAYEAVPDIKSLLGRIADSDKPFLDLGSDDGVRQLLWRIQNPADQQMLQALFAEVPVTYLTDGHHRTASASRYVAGLLETGRAPASDGAWNHVLVALFPHDELNVLPFNRCVRDLGDMGRDTFLSRLEADFEVTEILCNVDAPPSPRAPGHFCMVLDDRCYQLVTRVREVNPSSPATFLDVNLLQSLVLEPLLGIVDSRSDPRLEYVSGVTGSAGVNQLRKRGWQIAFYCYPASMEEIMTVSDAGQTMPPKSTCFEPKVRSGLFLRLNWKN